MSDLGNDCDFIRLVTKRGNYIDYIAKGKLDIFMEYIRECTKCDKLIRITNPFLEHSKYWFLEPNDIYDIELVPEERFLQPAIDITMFSESYQHHALVEMWKADLEEKQKAMALLGEYQKKMMESRKK